MAVAALIVAVLAIIIAAASARFTLRQTRAAEATERQNRKPQLSVSLNNLTGVRDTALLYTIRNVAPQDLDSVRITRPQTQDSVVYRIAPVGADYGPDVIEVGPLPLGAEAQFMLAAGSAEWLPAFWVKIECRAANDCWPLVLELPPPLRPPPSPSLY
jgi:hypothetical protein